MRVRSRTERTKLTNSSQTNSKIVTDLFLSLFNTMFFPASLSRMVLNMRRLACPIFCQISSNINRRYLDVTPVLQVHVLPSNGQSLHCVAGQSSCRLFQRVWTNQDSSKVMESRRGQLRLYFPKRLFFSFCNLWLKS